jgi:formate C-acetyltransferase
LREDILNQSDPVWLGYNELLWARSLISGAAERWNIVRRGRATADTLKGLPPEIGPHEILVGKFPNRPLNDAERAEFERWHDVQALATFGAFGGSHMAIDYERLLRLGLTGLRQEIEGYRARLDSTLPDDVAKDAFYRACLLTLDGVRVYSEHYAEHAEALAAQADDPARKAELLEIAQVCRRVPEHPAETFHEALQAVHFVTYCQCAGQLLIMFQLGRPDRYLLPYYRRDLAAGRLTPERAQELIDHLGLMLSAYTPARIAVGFMIGGRDGTGADVSNELTQMFLESIAHTRLPYPGIGLCWSKDTPSDITQRACELLADGLSHPAFFNDERITRGFMAAGLPISEACLYQHSTCVELSPIGSANVYVASPYHNMVQMLLDLLGVGRLNGDSPVVPLASAFSVQPARTFGSFDELLDAFEAYVLARTREGVIDANASIWTRYHHGGYPLLSCFVNDCLARGKDIDQGGARHTWVEPNYVGLANVVDGLLAIRTLVFERKVVSLQELAEALRDNYAGREDLRLMIMNDVPKYGTDDDEADALAVRLTSTIADACRRYRNPLGGGYHPGFFTFVLHELMGRDTPASPDGRAAETALSPGAGAAQGRERRGPTAAVLSATKWDHTPMLGGTAVNLKFSRPSSRDEFVRGLRSLIETFMERGGFEVQVNVVDRATLLAAREHPELYRDLLVRVGGYSDQFIGLSPGMQDEIILRTEHESI